MGEKKTRENENSVEITLESFADLVKQMRFTQRRYYRFHKSETRERMEELENQVDEAIEAIQHRQLTMF